MSVIVCFVLPRPLGFIGTPVVGEIRVREDIALDGTTTASTQDGEVIIVANNETDMVAGAVGTTPDPDATAKTTATSAGFPIPAGQTQVFFPATGAKFSAKAL